MEFNVQIPRTHEAIDEWIADPTPGVLETLGRTGGDFMVIGVGGKMGASTALMLKRGLDETGQKARVYGVSRFSDPAARERLESYGVETVSADVLEAEAVNQLPDARNILFLVGQKFGTAGNPEATWATNAVAPAFVCERFRNSRIVALSTGCVYPFVPVESGGATEETPMGPSGDYANSCVGRERVFAYYAGKYRLPTALVRLNYAIDPRYGVLLDIGMKVAAGEPVAIDTGWVNFIWQGDAVARSIQCFDHVSSPPFVINITGPETMAVRMIAARFGELLGRKPVLSGTESPTAWLSNASLSMKLFGQPRYNAEELIRIVAEHIRQDGVTLGKPTHFEARSGQF